MKIEIFALCDAATDGGGKLNILGAFDTINVNQFPAVHPQCTVVIRSRFSRIEEGAHNIAVNVVDEDGKSIVPTLRGQMNLKFSETRPSATANFILVLQNLKFEEPGEYSINLGINGREEATIPLYIVEKVPVP